MATPPSEVPWLRPLWVRIGLVVFVGVWCLVEWLWWHDPLFQWLTIAALVYAIWSLIISFDRTPPKDGDAGD
ncbi:MAG: DUF3329 domain-containing protein [Devosia sp.]